MAADTTDVVLAEPETQQNEANEENETPDRRADATNVVLAEPETHASKEDETLDRGDSPSVLQDNR